MEQNRKPTWKSGMLNSTYPTRMWYNADGSADFGMVAIPSKTGGKGTQYNDHFEGLVYEVILHPVVGNPEEARMECPCPGFEFRSDCRHVKLVKDELVKSQSSRQRLQ